MPTPIEILLDPVSLTVMALYGALIAWEALAPARPLPVVKGWRTGGIIAFLAYVMISTYLPLLWSEQLARFQLLDLTALGTWGGALVGVLVLEGGIYAWHRTMHRSSALWRVFHQMHHSAERLDTFGAFWFSPFDMVGWTVLSSLALTLMVGITPEAAMERAQSIHERTWAALEPYRQLEEQRDWWDEFVRRVLGHPSALRPEERAELRIIAE